MIGGSLTPEVCDISQVCFIWGIVIGLATGIIIGWFLRYLLIGRYQEGLISYLSRFCETFEWKGRKKK